MPTTLNPKTTRWVLTARSASPQGSGAIEELTRTAYAAMAASAWQSDDSAPTIPVHDYDRAIPTGDAFKATWGYSAADRTEQAALGAVCYSFPVPSGAVGGTLTQIAATLYGDRYLDKGAYLQLFVTASETPPSWADIMAADPGDAYCATEGQAPTAPNKRTNTTAAATVSGPSDALASGDWCHVVLRLVDYTTVRGAWIEGGCMVGSEGISATFSADGVAEDGPPGEVQIVPTWFFGPTSTADRTIVGSSSPDIKNLLLTNAPMCDFRGIYILSTTKSQDFGSLSEEHRVKLALQVAHLGSEDHFQVLCLSSSGAADDAAYQFSYNSRSIVFGTRTKTVADVGRTQCLIGYCAIEGWLGGRTYSRIRFDSPIEPSGCDALVSVYYSPGPLALESGIGNFHNVAVFGSKGIFDDHVHLGRATSAAASGYSIQNVSPGGFAANVGYLRQLTLPDKFQTLPTVPLTPLVRQTVMRGESEGVFVFSEPLHGAEYGVFFVFIVPEWREGATLGTATWTPSAFFVS